MHKVPAWASDPTFQQQFTNFKTREREINQQLGEINRQKRLIEQELRTQGNTILSATGVKNAETLDWSLDGWECEESPIKVCVYDWPVDGECCIFCGDPEERK